MATSLSWLQSTEQEQFPLNQLPVDCLGEVLSHLSPRDTCRLSCVSSEWKQAAESEKAWRRIIPWRHSATSQFPALNSALSARHAFNLLLAGCPSFDGNFVLKANSGTGRISLRASAIFNFSIVRIDPQEETWNGWLMHDLAGSEFAVCALLEDVCRFVIQGRLSPDVALFPGVYRLSWRVAKRLETFQWPSPASCSVVLAGDHRVLQKVPVDFTVPGTSRSESRTPGEHEGGRPGLPGVPGMGEGTPEDELTEEDEDKPTEEDEDKLTEEDEDELTEEDEDELTEEDENEPTEEDEDELTEEDEDEFTEVDEDGLTWEEYVVGEVMLEDRGDGLASFDADIDLVETESGLRKGGLYVDSFMLTHCG